MSASIRQTSLRFDRLAQNASDAVARNFYLEQRSERRGDVRRAGVGVVGSGSDSSAVEDHGHVRIVGVRRAVCGRNAFGDEEEGLRHYDEIAVAVGVKAVRHAARYPGLRQSA